MVSFQGRGIGVATGRCFCSYLGRGNANQRSVCYNDECGYDIRSCGTTRHHSREFRNSVGKPQGTFDERGEFTAQCRVYEIC